MNDRHAEFVRLLKRHDRRLAAYIFSMVPDWNDAEDLLQDTCVRLWEQFEEYRPDGDFGAWACTVARYMVLAYRKRVEREKLQFRSDVLDALEAQVAGGHAESERRLQALVDCVRKLSDFARDLLHRCYAKGAKIKDVAVEMGMTVNGAYLTLSRLRHDLHDCVEAALRQENKP